MHCCGAAMIGMWGVCFQQYTALTLLVGFDLLQNFDLFGNNL